MTDPKIYVFDLDGTLCTKTPLGGDYSLAEPQVEMISKLNELKRLGNKIVIFTARGMIRFKGDVEKIEKELGQLTRDWLREHGVEYDALLFGKPPADFYVDDRALSIYELLIPRKFSE